MRKIHISIALIIFSGSLFSCGCRSVQPKATAVPELLAEFEMKEGVEHITVPVTFQGKEYPFALDTGSMRTVFDDSFKEKLGRRFMWPLKGKGPEGKTFKIEYYRGHHPRLGPLALDDTSLLRVCDLDKLVPSEKRDFQGIIGMEFLQKYILQIDFDNRKVTLFRGRKDIASFFPFRPNENRHPEWGEAIPLKTKPLSNIRYVKGDIDNNIGGEFMVDTGWYSLDSLKSKIFDKIHLRKNSSGESRDTTLSSTGLSGYDVLNEVGDFSVGSLEYGKHVFRRSDESVLGLAFLYGHLVTLDFLNNTMYLKKGKYFDTQPVFLEIVRIGCQVQAESYIVQEVDPNSPAYRKVIREEDILIRVDDRDVSSFGIVEFIEFLSSLSELEEGERTFTFKRGDEMIAVPVSKLNMDANKK